jgi:hypothetical protein
LPFLRAEWRGPEATVRELDAEMPDPLGRVVEDNNAPHAARPFGQRLRENLAKALDGKLQ